MFSDVPKPDPLDFGITWDIRDGKMPHRPYMESVQNGLIGLDQIKKFESVVDKLFAKYDIDFNFTRHFGDRMDDSRNDPSITLKELAEFIKKMYKRQGKSIKSVAGAEAVLKDIQSDLNIPVAVTYDRNNDEFDVVLKTIMRKKNFTSPDKVIKYEENDMTNQLPEGFMDTFLGKNMQEVKQDSDVEDKKGSQPSKYYAKDADGDKMSKSTKEKRAAYFAKGGSKKPAPGDSGAKTKESKHTKKYNKMFGEEDPCWDTHKQVGMKKKGGKMVPNCVAKEGYDYPPEVELILLDEKIEGLITKADKSGIPYGILKKVYDRGMAAWKTGHRPGTTPQQWAFARVNSFVTKSSGTWGKADKDLAQQVRGEETVEDSREIGTDAQRTERQKMTPGQPVISFKEHIDCGTEDCCQECETASLIESNVYRVGSEKYYEFFQEKRVEYKSGEFNPTGFNKDLMEGDIGKYAIYEGKNVALECPMMEADYQGTEVELNKPKSGGSKKYYVYVKNDKGNVIKVSWGDTTGLKVKLNDKAARKSFAARHDCANKKDKTKAGYWACNLPRYAKQLGLSGGGSFFW